MEKNLIFVYYAHTIILLFIHKVLACATGTYFGPAAIFSLKTMCV